MGHWLGVTLFSLCSLAIGLGLALGLSRYLGIEIDRGRAAIALAQTMGGVMLFAALGVGLGSNASVALAAGVTVLLVFLPPVVTILAADKKPWQHYPGVVLDLVIPPGYTSHYLGIAWADLPPPSTPRLNARARPHAAADAMRPLTEGILAGDTDADESLSNVTSEAAQQIGAPSNGGWPRCD